MNRLINLKSLSKSLTYLGFVRLGVNVLQNLMRLQMDINVSIRSARSALRKVETLEEWLYLLNMH